MSIIIECVPNFSEGKNQKILNTIQEAIEEVNAVQLLHVDAGKAANRTVFTYAGEMHAVFQATYNAIKVAVEQIDMRQQKGEHPRIGACDVCPFIPISGITLQELIPHVNAFAQKVAKDFNLPVFLYEESASSLKRKNLANHRVGDYENLEQRMKSMRWEADYGNQFNPHTGGMVTGARKFLVAYNINLATKDVNIAKEIAYDIRELGRPIKSENGKLNFKKGLLKNVKAIGWYIKDFDKVQVSINLTDYKKTSLFQVFEATKMLAEQYETCVTGSELIGLIPLNALISTGKLYSSSSNATEKELVDTAIHQLGLGELSPFQSNKRILEYVLKL